MCFHRNSKITLNGFLNSGIDRGALFLDAHTQSMGTSQSHDQCKPCSECLKCDECVQCPVQDIYTCNTDILTSAHNGKKADKLTKFTEDRKVKENDILSIQSVIKDLESENVQNTNMIVSLIGSINDVRKDEEDWSDGTIGLNTCLDESKKKKETATSCEQNEKTASLASRNQTCTGLRLAKGQNDILNGDGWAQCGCPNGISKDDHEICAPNTENCVECNSKYYLKENICKFKLDCAAAGKAIDLESDEPACKSCESGEYVSNDICKTFESSKLAFLELEKKGKIYMRSDNGVKCGLKIAKKGNTGDYYPAVVDCNIEKDNEINDVWIDGDDKILYAVLRPFREKPRLCHLTPTNRSGTDRFKHNLVGGNDEVMWNCGEEGSGALGHVGHEWKRTGEGVCRDRNSKYPAWGWEGTTNTKSAEERCITDESCTAIWHHSNGQHQFFCTQKGGVCTDNGNDGNANDLRGSNTQNNNECRVLSRPTATMKIENNTNITFYEKRGSTNKIGEYGDTYYLRATETMDKDNTNHTTHINGGLYDQEALLTMDSSWGDNFWFEKSFKECSDADEFYNIKTKQCEAFELKMLQLKSDYSRKDDAEAKEIRNALILRGKLSMADIRKITGI